MSTASSDEEFLSAFFLVSNAKDFPNSANIEICSKKTDEACHKVLKQVERAKDELLKIPHEKALTLVLKQIHQYCKLENPLSLENEAKCSGAFSAIYYFNTSKDEKKIANSLKQLNQETLIQLLRNRRSWFFNRTEIPTWKEFAELKLSEPWKEIFLENLQKKSPQAFGLQLLDRNN
ncbi:hypothetical protein [Aliikangiella sp. IMCC44359]|uniref:hypothetical protein n=1 Tax=Aliikangiella sp. IMCC44359 TaxID=3459125 RepID=UPI00403A8D5F